MRKVGRRGWMSKRKQEEKEQGREETTSGRRAVICRVHLWVLHTKPQHVGLWGIIRERY